MVETPAKNEENVYKVTIKYVDEGRTSQVSSDQLLHLPAKFQSLPPQAVEIIVCRVKPIDNEVEWNPKVINKFCMVFSLCPSPSLSVIFYKKRVPNCWLGYQITLLASIDTKYLLLGQILRRSILGFFFVFLWKNAVKFMDFFSPLI